MSEKLKKLEAKKILQEYSFLLTDNEYKIELINEQKTEFLQQINDLKQKMGVSFEPNIGKEQNKKNEIKPKKINNENLSPKTKSKLKKIFREIVKLTHPDKINSEEFIEIYRKSVEAFESNDVIFLYKICSDLNINFEFDNEDVDILSVLIIDKKEEIKKIESSFVWLWMKANTDEEKHKVVEMFIKQTTTG